MTTSTQVEQAAEPRYAAGPKFSGPDEHFPGDELFDLGPRTRAEVGQDVAGTGLALAADAVLVWRCVRTWREPGAVAGGALGVVAGMYAADLVSGVLHWAFDTWFDAGVAPVRRVVVIVREHHVYPQRIFKYGLAEDVGLMSWFGLLVGAPVAVAAATGRPRDVRRAAATAAFGLSYSVLVSVSLELHKAGHGFEPGPATRLAQRTGLLLTPRHHMKHHAGEHDSHYCLVNGWADRTLGELGLFDVLERVIARVSAARPREDDRRWRRMFGRWVRADDARRRGTGRHTTSTGGRDAW